MTVLKAWFWISAALIAYVYSGYPVIAAIVGRLRRQPAISSRLRPRVTVLIAAYNEEQPIVATVRNKLEQNYPPDLLDVIVVSDASSDATDTLVTGIADPRVRLLRQPQRSGKTAALNRAALEASGEILVFSDANSIYDVNAVACLVENFADPSIGYVTGKMIYVNDDNSIVGDGCTAYMRYENRLRAIENRLGNVVGVDGGIDAIRRALYVPMRADQLPDLVLPLHVVATGHRVVYDPRALLREKVLTESGDEFRMRVRVALRALWALWDMRGLLWSWHRPLFSWQLWSHKLLRYLAFIPLLTTTLASMLLAGESWIYALALTTHLLLFALALVGMRDSIGQRFALARFATYFMLLNIASAVATFRFLKGEKQAIWKPRKG